VSKVGLARELARELFHFGFKLRKREYRKLMLSRPCIYGTFGGRFGGFHPIKDRCTGCLRCVQEYPSICKVERNPEFFSFPDSYWIPDDPATACTTPVSTVSYEASTGKIQVKGMGYKGAFAGRGWDGIWTDMSEIVRPTRDGVYGREYISTLVDLGRKPKFLEFQDKRILGFSKTVELPIPVIFDYLPPNLNSRSIIDSVASACVKARTCFIATPEQLTNVPERDLAHFILLLTSISNGEESWRDAAAIELAEYDASDVTEIRETNRTAPIIVRLPLTKTAHITAAELAQEGVDAIHLVANYHGQNWDSGGATFVSDSIRSVHQHLVKVGLRDELTIIASGGITLAEHVPKAILCGADLVALDTTTLVALQAQFMGQCVSADSGKIKDEEFNSQWGEQRLINLLAAWHDQIIEILSAMGMRDIRRLRGDVGRAIFNEEMEREAFADIINRA
jgi:hypothetical protein